nr:TPA_asm: CYTB [Gammarus fossarum]
MTSNTLKANSLMKVMSGTLITLPAPSNISTMWNFGSLLSMSLALQIISGLLLASSYSPDLHSSFQLISQSMEAMDKYWLLRYTHANGASLFFVCMYAHIGRGIYYSSFVYTNVWLTGVTILLMTMATAFMGYVLPVNQMSYWGASVITNLFSEIPYIGPTMVQFMWGGVSVDSPTIMRFLTFHFLLPFLITTLVLMHITFLHQQGSNNPLGLSSNTTKINFNLFFSMKDTLGVLIMSVMFLMLILYWPMTLGDKENFNKADPAITPQHIQPEWYFLFPYAILRSIPNKLGGVIALIMSVTILYSMPYTFTPKMKSNFFYPFNALLFWSFIATIILLTWIGMRPVEQPFIITGQILTLLYFSYFISSPLLLKMWDKLSN